MTDLPPRTRDAERSRTAILDAAEQLFAAEGFEAVTMARIGAAAGVSRGTPGYFFGSKEDLYRTVVQRAVTALSTLGSDLGVEAARSGVTPGAVIARTVRAFVDCVTASPSIVRLIQREDGRLAGTALADALVTALAPLGADAPAIAMRVLGLVWLPLAQPHVARRLGVDLGDGASVDRWTAEVVALAAAASTPVTAPAPAAAPSDVPPALPEPGPSAGASPPTDPRPWMDAAGRKKKKKKKKRKE